MEEQQNTALPELAAMGLWTPRAEVLCFDCHGNTFYRGFGESLVLDEAEMAEKNTPVPVKEWNRITSCNKCSRLIQLDDSIAAEHNLVVVLREAGMDAEMHQTGGMNSACGINLINGGYHLVTYNWDGDGCYVVAEFDSEDTWINDPNYFVTDSYDEMVAYIKSLVKVKRIEKEG
ncbi:hypothetical protein ACLBWT_18410 [Paenibacillus sp. D51F]